MPRDIFDLPNYDIAPGKRFRRRDDAPERTPPLPALVEVTELESPTAMREGRVIFVDPRFPGSPFILGISDFRNEHDPA